MARLRAMLDPILIQGVQPGGQLTITTDVENYPGFADVIQGPWLMEQMQKQAEHVGTKKIVTDHVNKVELGRRPFRIECDFGDAYFADSLVLATGAQARWLDLPAEQKFRGYGVSACATCDGFFYRGKEVLVIGGGNTAVEEALFLTNFASKVTVVHRRDSFRAERILQERLYHNPKISVLWHTVLDDVIGDDNPLKSAPRCCATSRPMKSRNARPTAFSSLLATRRPPAPYRCPAHEEVSAQASIASSAGLVKSVLTLNKKPGRETDARRVREDVAIGSGGGLLLALSLRRAIASPVNVHA